ncbi:MAG TPA: lysine--tRNA ligase [Candidatus Limnocylindria bacterium]|nr:lysine--tRNA ligase [Candidatus Limnocylindria bacterium]
MFWADELAARVSGPQVVNDSKTPSGTVHVGSLRGPIILDVIARALRARGLETTLLYGIEDLDPMDAQALLTPDAVQRYMGVPLAHVPDPASDGHGSYARHFAGLFIGTFDRLGIHPDRYYWMSELYDAGELDRYIRLALDRAAAVRDIYLRVSRVQRPPGWLPVHLICPSCGKVGTTLARDWDGETVATECLPDLVEWATGCGFAGRLSPFGGGAKLPWNLEWAAQWSHFGVTIEPCGKDLATAGGSRDRSDAIAREVFDRDPPVNLPYEFLNIGGRKMSTSRGRGEAAHRIAEVVPPEQLRFLFVRPRPNHAIDWDPDGTDAIPRLFDEWDRVAAASAGLPVRGELPPDPERVFAAALLDPDADAAVEGGHYRPAFAHVALLSQVPGVDLRERVEAEKGAALTAREVELLEERLRAARAWLETYAPDRARLTVHDDALPHAVGELDLAQQAVLASLADALDAVPEDAWSGEVLQGAIFDAARAAELPPGRAFAALYAAFLGQPHGPRAGWLLASLERPFVVRRLREAAAADTLQA